MHATTTSVHHHLTYNGTEPPWFPWESQNVASAATFLDKLPKVETSNEELTEKSEAFLTSSCYSKIEVPCRGIGSQGLNDVLRPR